MMLFIQSKRTNTLIERILEKLLQHVKDDLQDIVLDIFNCGDMKPEHPIRLPLPEDPLFFVKREKYSEDIVEGVLDLVIEFVKDVLGEKDAESSVDNLSRHKNSEDDYQPHRVMAGENPMLVILDSVSLMDEASWKLLELIKDECSQIAVVMLVQTDTNNQPKIHPEAKQFY